MLAQNFGESYYRFENFAVWEIENIADFFEGNGVLKVIFEEEYDIPFALFQEKRQEIEESDMMMMERILSLVNDKYFHIFTLHNPNHLELVKLQMLKVMNFGMDIEQIEEDRVYVMIMDRKQDSVVGFEAN